MWLFTPIGFLSIVADYDVPADALVRARVLEDLEEFCPRTSARAPAETPHRDYRYRTSVPFTVLAAELAAQAQQIDSPNFKSEVAERQGSPSARPPTGASGRSCTSCRSARRGGGVGEQPGSRGRGLDGQARVCSAKATTFRAALSAVLRAWADTVVKP